MKDKQNLIEEVLQKVLEVLDGHTTDFADKIIYRLNIEIAHIKNKAIMSSK